LRKIADSELFFLAIASVLTSLSYHRINLGISQTVRRYASSVLLIFGGDPSIDKRIERLKNELSRHLG
jgi:hypothetical protein